MRFITSNIGTTISRLVVFCMVVTLCVYLGTGCGASAPENLPTPPEYDLNNPYKVNMSEQLDEISGIDFYAKDTSVFAIMDEEGVLYKVFLKTRAFQKWKFGKNADYEDLRRLGSSFYVLISNGDITRVDFKDDSVHAETFQFPERKGNEFESLHYDSTAGQFILICKDCDRDKKAAVSIWTFNPATNTYKLAPYQIDVAPLAESMGEKKVRFKPAASAINPVTGDLYMVSAVNKVLVIADTKGKIKKIYHLNPSLYHQCCVLAQ